MYGVIDDRFERLLALDHALANMTEAGADGALPCPAPPIVWADYRRQKGGLIVSVKCGSSDVIRRSGASLKHWKLALWRRPRVALWGIQGLVVELYCPTIALRNADVSVYYYVTY